MIASRNLTQLNRVDYHHLQIKLDTTTCISRDYSPSTEGFRIIGAHNDVVNPYSISKRCLAQLSCVK